MNQRAVKAIRANMHYPKKRTYFKTPNGSIVADKPRNLYQQMKKQYLLVRKERSFKHGH